MTHSPISTRRCSPRSARLLALCCALAAAACIARANPATASEPLRLEGFTEAYRDLQIGSSDTTVVAEVLAEEGERVRLGQTLVQLDSTVLKAAVEVARTAAAARGEAAVAEESLRARRRRLQQTEDLCARDHATDQELWNAQSECAEAEARVKAFHEMIERRELELHQAEMQLARLSVKSPIDGVVVAVLKDVGEVVSPADPHLLRIVQLDPLKVSASGPEKQLRLVKVGVRLPVIADGQRYEGVVEFVSPIVDAQSGMRSLKLRLPNPDLKITSGLHVEVHLQPIEVPSTRENTLQQTLRSFPFLNRK